MSVIPMGIVTRTVRALVGDLLSPGIRARAARQGPDRSAACSCTSLKNAAPTAIAVMGLQLGYLLGGSILIETVFSWPGTGFLLNNAIFQRDLPLLQGTILVLALFFVVLNLLVDVLQAAIDPRIKRGLTCMSAVADDLVRHRQGRQGARLLGRPSARRLVARSGQRRLRASDPV